MEDGWGQGQRWLGRECISLSGSMQHFGFYSKCDKRNSRILNIMVKLSYVEIDCLGCYVQSKINNKETIE